MRHPVDADWSNLPMRPFYLPLLQRLSIYLASTVFPPRNLDVGKPIVAFLPAADAGKKAMLSTPEGVTLEVPIVKKNERGVAEFGRTQHPGLYTLTPPGGPPIAYVVNASRKESDLQKLTAKEIADFARTHGVTVVHSGAEYRELDHAQRYGMEFWRPLLWALLAVLFLEIFLQQRFARARGGRRSAREVRGCHERKRAHDSAISRGLAMVGRRRPRPPARRHCLVFLSPRDAPHPAHLHWLLPALRSLAIVMLVLMLCQPALHHRKVIGQLAKLFLFVDGSKSMGLTDSAMDAGRKILILQRLGMLPEGAVAMDLPKAGEALAEAQALAERARDAQKAPMEEWQAMIKSCAAKIEDAWALSSKAGGDQGRIDAFKREIVDPSREIGQREFQATR